jgi:hypothetical protein
MAGKKITRYDATGKKITTSTKARLPPSWVARHLSTGDLSTIPEWARKKFDATGKKITTYTADEREITPPVSAPTPEARVALNCILDCLSTGNSVPDWAPNTVRAAIARVDSHEVEWNDVFGRPLEKRKTTGRRTAQSAVGADSI